MTHAFSLPAMSARFRPARFYARRLTPGRLPALVILATLWMAVQAPLDAGLGDAAALSAMNAFVNVEAWWSQEALSPALGLLTYRALVASLVIGVPTLLLATIFRRSDLASFMGLGATWTLAASAVFPELVNVCPCAWKEAVATLALGLGMGAATWAATSGRAEDVR